MSGIEVGWLAVEVDRTSVVYFEIVITVLKCAFQADAFSFTASDVKIKLWAATACLGINADVYWEQRVPDSGDAELVVRVVVTDLCVSSCGIVGRSEGVGGRRCGDSNCS